MNNEDLNDKFMAGVAHVAGSFCLLATESISEVCLPMEARLCQQCI
jgi:hypothetical protein